jgi:hypothetical protein
LRISESLFKKMSVVFISISIVSVIMIVADNKRAPEINDVGKSVLQRGIYGSGNKDVELDAVLNGKRKSLNVTVNEQEYSMNEILNIFDMTVKQLEQLILGENKSLDAVRYDMNLVERIPGSGINIRWETDNLQVLKLTGELQNENLTEQGVLVELRAMLSYADQQAVHVFHVNIYPPDLDDAEKQILKLEQKISEYEESSREDKAFILPDKLDEIPIVWRYPSDSRGWGMFFIGIVATGSLYALDIHKKRQRMEARKSQLAADYAQFISQFTLYMSAGMTARSAWFRMVQEHKKAGGKKQQILYEEMRYAMHEIQGGVSENECYERFGSRCGLPSYRKFGVLISQNLRKGTRGLTDLLRIEAAQAFEERKKQARRMGEEAGTKLLGPMFMMLGVVLIILVVPAFFTISI